MGSYTYADMDMVSVQICHTYRHIWTLTGLMWQQYIRWFVVVLVSGVFVCTPQFSIGPAVLMHLSNNGVLLLLCLFHFLLGICFCFCQLSDGLFFMFTLAYLCRRCASCLISNQACLSSTSGSEIMLQHQTVLYCHSWWQWEGFHKHFHMFQYTVVSCFKHAAHLQR